jgi:hypothetical protein
MPPPQKPKPWFAWYPVKALVRLSDRPHALPLPKAPNANGRFNQADIGRERWFWMTTIERVWRNGRWDRSIPVRRDEGQGE